MAYLRKQNKKEIQIFLDNRFASIYFYKIDRWYKFDIINMTLHHGSAFCEPLKKFRSGNMSVFNFLNFPDIIIDYILSDEKSKLQLAKDYIVKEYLTNTNNKILKLAENGIFEKTN